MKRPKVGMQTLTRVVPECSGNTIVQPMIQYDENVDAGTGAPWFFGFITKVEF